MMAVPLKLRDARDHGGQLKPSSSGMHTSIRISPISFLSRHSNASRAEDAFEQILADLRQHHFRAQELRLWSSTSRMFTRSKASCALTGAATCAARQELVDVDGFCQVIPMRRPRGIFRGRPSSAFAVSARIGSRLKAGFERISWMVSYRPIRAS